MTRDRDIGTAVRAAVACALPLCTVLAGCRSAESYRTESDRAAYAIVDATQRRALGRTEPFTIDRPEETLRRKLVLQQGLPVGDPVSLGTSEMVPIEQWPDSGYLESSAEHLAATQTVPEVGALQLGLIDALQVAARNSRDYQDQKEAVFRAALALDFERDQFDTSFTGGVQGEALADLDPDGDLEGVSASPTLGFERRFLNGMTVTGRIGADLARILTNDVGSVFGTFADGSISVPLLRGSGRFVVGEPLTQAERDTVYAIYTFERFKRQFAVRIASSYLGVLRQLDQVANAQQNYESLVLNTRRLRARAQVGKESELQLAQAVQDELRARDRWISAQQSYARVLDNFRIELGLPTDAMVELDREELSQLGEAVSRALELDAQAQTTESSASGSADEPVVLPPPGQGKPGPLELAESTAVVLALANRLDLRTTLGRVLDAQRQVAIAADALRAELTLLGNVDLGDRRSIASANGPDGNGLQFDRGRYQALLSLDLPFERTAERNAYRNSLINLERAVRSYQALEDDVKLDVRERLRTLLRSREGLRIQRAAVEVAQRRVESATLLNDLGRVEIRDVLEAQEALLSAQNALTAALVDYRVAELELQRDIGVLEVNEDALWREFDPSILNLTPVPVPDGPPVPNAG